MKHKSGYFSSRNCALATSAAVVLLLATMAVPCAQAQAYKVICSFKGTGGDGRNPSASLVLDSAGNLYGTTSLGGTSDSGTAFELQPSGKEVVLHSFKGIPDGELPTSSLVPDGHGHFYGTTFEGGAYGYGSIFKIGDTGTESVVDSFCVTGCSGGSFPNSKVILDGEGNFYGTTNAGGDFDCGSRTGCGTVFKFDANGTETVLQTFEGSNGAVPSGGVIRDNSDNLYGLTIFGGAYGYGVLFAIDAGGNETVKYNFTGGADGGEPYSGLIRDDNGDFYGTTYQGGAYNLGTVFKVDASGNEFVLYSFAGGADGANPYGSVIRDKMGNIYGTTYQGGAYNLGTVFKVDATGNKTLLHSFAGKKDGANPYAGVVQDADGNLYGTTFQGGAYNDGTVFKLTP